MVGEGSEGTGGRSREAVEAAKSSGTGEAREAKAGGSRGEARKEVTSAKAREALDRWWTPASPVNEGETEDPAKGRAERHTEFYVFDLGMLFDYRET